MAISNGVMKGWRDFPDFTNSIYYAFVIIAWTALYFGVPSILTQRADHERLLQRS